MAKSQKNARNSSRKINKIGVTSDVLTSRGGLAIFSQYLDSTNIIAQLANLFGCIRKSSKGLSVDIIFKQILCFFMDKTSRSLTYFDNLKMDEGYAASLELTQEEMLSSHSVKRFLKAFSLPMAWMFRNVLKYLFLWRLQLEKPDVICLGLDSMVMDNDEAKRRAGVQPTYKNKMGFQPLQMTWHRFIVDALFRGGKKHCNAGNSAANMIKRMVKWIRKNYRSDVPVVVLMDSGFMDEKLFEALEKMDIGYICNGKRYDDILRYVEEVEDEHWNQYSKGKESWHYFEYEDQRDCWTKSRRAIITRYTPDDLQQTFEAFRPLSILYTNLGKGEAVDGFLKNAGRQDLWESEAIVKSSHGRGRDELVHRAFKDFGFEELPFKNFAPNAAFYYMMVLGHFLYECFKEDVCGDSVPVTSYASTLRRKVIDIAAKIVRSGGSIWIKFTQRVWNTLQIDQLWERCKNPPPLPTW